MNPKAITKYIGLLLKITLESRRQNNLQAEVISKRINNLEKIVGLMANACLESGFHNSGTFEVIKGFAESGIGDEFRVMFSQEIAALDYLETLIEQFNSLAGLDPKPEEPA